MVKVCMGDHYEIDQWHQLEAESGLALTFNHAVPVRPVRIDDHGMIGELNKKRGMAYPGDPDHTLVRCVWDGFALFAITLLKDLGKQAVAQEVVVASWPSFFGKDAGVVSARFGFGPFGSRIGHDLK